MSFVEPLRASLPSRVPAVAAWATAAKAVAAWAVVTLVAVRAGTSSKNEWTSRTSTAAQTRGRCSGTIQLAERRRQRLARQQQ